MKVRQRTLMNNKDKKELISRLTAKYGESIQSILDKKTQIEYVRLENKEEIYLINGCPAIFANNEIIIPMLNFLGTQEFPIKTIVVDAGAIKFVSSGADVMRPGIVEIDASIAKDECILIREITHKKPLAVGIALYGGEEIKAMQTGRVVKNIHHVGDQYYSIAKEL